MKSTAANVAILSTSIIQQNNSIFAKYYWCGLPWSPVLVLFKQPKQAAKGVPITGAWWKFSTEKYVIQVVILDSTQKTRTEQRRPSHELRAPVDVVHEADEVPRHIVLLLAHTPPPFPEVEILARPCRTAGGVMLVVSIYRFDDV